MDARVRYALFLVSLLCVAGCVSAMAVLGTFPWLSAGLVGVGLVVLATVRVAELAHRAPHDLLTGLANRDSFVGRLHDAWSVPATRSHLALVVIDLDDFKIVNDGVGQRAGDELLMAVAARLQAWCPRRAVVARLGGDEFAVLAHDIGGRSSAAQLGHELCELFEEPFLTAGRRMKVRCSAGVALSSSATSPEDMLRFADTAMYAAKARGKARYQLFVATMSTEVTADLEHRCALEQALEHEEFVLHYQPIVDLTTDMASGFEVLLRWEHPVRGLLQPSAFLGTAERLGILVEIERWVLLEACREAAQWAPIPTCAPPIVGVNLSATHLQHPDLVAHVSNALTRSGLDAARLILEVTEGALLEDVPAVQRNLGCLTHLGVRIALDDFGTGYSSLSYLDRLPVDTIKIDQSFITDAPRPIVHAILDMARELGMTVVAEGVETEAQADWLRSGGCNLLQGFLYDRPLPSASLGRWLPRWCGPVTADAACPEHVGVGIGA